MASAESIVYTALKGLAGARVFPDLAPTNTIRPYIVYQGVGGQDASTFDGLANTQNCRMQVAVWADRRSDAADLMRQVQQILCNAPILGTPIGAPVSVYEDDTKLYGSRLDVSIWFKP